MVEKKKSATYLGCFRKHGVKLMQNKLTARMRMLSLRQLANYMMKAKFAALISCFRQKSYKPDLVWMIPFIHFAAYLIDVKFSFPREILEEFFL